MIGAPQIELPAFGWRLRPHQIDVWRAFRDWNIHEAAWCAHRRTGKDEVAIQATVMNMLERVGSYWHLMPEFEQARKAIWEEVNPDTGRKRYQDFFPREIIKHVDSTRMSIEIINGSVWRLVGSDKYDTKVGSSAMQLTFSEMALSDPMAYVVLSPMVVKNNGKIIHISTPRGRNHFYRICEALKKRSDGFYKYTPATATKVFTQEELDQQRISLIAALDMAQGEAMFQQEYLCNWDAATIGACWGAAIAKLYADGRARPCAYDPRYPVFTSWDLGIRDRTVVLFWQEIGTSEYRLIDWYSSTESGLEHYAEMLEKKPYWYAGHIAPHDIIVRDFGTGVQRIDLARRSFGIEFTQVRRVDHKEDNVAYGIQFFPKVVVNVNPDGRDESTDDCQFVLDALANYHWRYDERTRTLSREPVHDWSSDYADAFATMAHYVQSQPRGQLLPRARVQGLQGKGAYFPAATPRHWWPGAQPSVKRQGFCL